MAQLLTIPLKKSSDVDIVTPLRNLIQATYSGAEGLEDCSDALNELARLRSQAIWKLFDNSSLDVIYNYYDQLAALESKVPPQEVAVPFKWKDAFDRGSIFGGRMSLTVSSLSFERVCVMFNMAALQSSLAARQALHTEEELKQAAKLCQQAAGIMAHLKANVLSVVHADPTPDLSPDTLHALSALMLAQAQEVIVYKCIRDEMKEGTVARVCSAAEEMYTDALRALQRESVKALWDRDWIPTVQAKQLAFRGLTQLYQAAVCRGAGAVGETIARLKLAVEALKGAGAGPAGSGGRLAGVAPLADAAARAQRQLNEVTKDNDFIYHERIPEAAQLEPVGRAPIAKALPIPDKWGEGQDLFGSLVPLALHSALQASAARRAEAVGGEIARLRDATQLLNSILASLSLPACIESSGAGSGGLPASLRERAAVVRAAGGLPALQALVSELPDLLQRNRDILNEAERMLREEAEADSTLRAQFGAKWTRTESAKLTEAFRANAAKYAQIIDNAVRADNIVQQKFQQHKDNIALLSGSEGALSAGLPAAEGGAGGADQDAVNELRTLMRQVEALKAERDSLEIELKELKVDVSSALAAAHAAGQLDEQSVTRAALQEALGPLSKRAASSLARQEELVSEIQTAHAALMAARGGACDRDQALGSLAAAADAYDELSNNLKEGVKFYNDLTQLLVAFQNKVSDFCFARKTEKDELLKDLTQEASRPSQPPAAQEPQMTRREAPPRPAPPAPTPAAPTPSALPYPTQPQGMPLPYGAPAVAPYPYYAAPMPVAYNPYATLPYPHHARMPPTPAYQPYQHPPPSNPYAPPPAGYSPYQPPPQ